MKPLKPWEVHTQQWIDDSWDTTQRGAIRGALRMLSAWRTEGIRVVAR